MNFTGKVVLYDLAMESIKPHVHALVFLCILKSAHAHYETSKESGYRSVSLYARDCKITKNTVSNFAISSAGDQFLNRNGVTLQENAHRPLFPVSK